MAKIELLPPDNFRTFKTWVSDKGNLNPVFVASFAHPNEKRPVDMYVKIYPMTVEDRSIFNEIVAYLMADALGIPQPQYACIAFIQVAEIMQNDDVDFFDTDFGKMISEYDTYPVFCTSKIDKSLTAFEYTIQANGSSPTPTALITELAACNGFTKAAAMDSTIAHIDRHMNNLLRTGKNKYFFIDNDQLVIKYQHHGWLVADLDVNKKYNNKLYNFAKKAFNSRQIGKFNSLMIHESQSHAQAWQSICSELEDWKNKIYQQHVADYNDFIAFLSARCVSAHAHTTSRVQLLI
jgi:hypothetical protein